MMSYDILPEHDAPHYGSRSPLFCPPPGPCLSFTKAWTEMTFLKSSLQVCLGEPPQEPKWTTEKKMPTCKLVNSGSISPGSGYFHYETIWQHVENTLNITPWTDRTPAQYDWLLLLKSGTCSLASNLSSPTKGRIHPTIPISCLTNLVTSTSNI